MKGQNHTDDINQFLNKKLQTAFQTITKSEKKSLNEIISEEPTAILLVFHHGQGDEDDQKVLSQFLQDKGLFQLYFFPSKSYALAYFESVEHTQKLMDGLVRNQENNKIRYVSLQFCKKQRYTMFFYSKLKNTEIINENDIPDAKLSIDIPGLSLVKDYITLEEEQQIIQFIDKQKWQKGEQSRIQIFTNQFPRELSKYEELGNELIIQENHPGIAQKPIIENHQLYGPKIYIVSLLSGMVMTFKSQNGNEKHLFIPPRSCLLLEDEVRYAWMNFILPRKIDKVEGIIYYRKRRISLTFKSVKDSKCNCNYPKFCDTQQKQESKTVPIKTEEETKLIDQFQNETETTEIEKKYVYEIYDKIAPHFSNTRYKPWPRIEAFLKSLEPGSLVADVGCGNGKYLGVNKDLFMIGTDRSQNLIKICKERDATFEVFSADGLNLPWRNGIFDAVISIAVIHHFSNKLLRKNAINQLLRITKNQGLILIYVWAFEQDEKLFKEQDVFVPWNLQYKYEDEDVFKKQEEEQKDQGFGVQDYQINDEKKTVVYKRYYHVFKEGEIEELLNEMEGFSIIDRYFGIIYQLLKIILQIMQIGWYFSKKIDFVQRKLIFSVAYKLYLIRNLQIQMLMLLIFFKQTKKQLLKNHSVIFLFKIINQFYSIYLIF